MCRQGAGVEKRGASSGVLYWLRQDLRLHDNPGLCAAALEAQRRRSKLTLVYVSSLQEDGDDLGSGVTRPGPLSACCGRVAKLLLSSLIALVLS
jgi:hypothetical protein